MSKVVALMSMPLDGYVADRSDGVDEVFDWHFASGDLEFPAGGSDPMTFQVSEPSAESVYKKFQLVNLLSIKPVMAI